jgi:hypothetical protein
MMAREDDAKPGRKNYSDSLVLVKDNGLGCNYFKITSFTTRIGKE